MFGLALGLGAAALYFSTVGSKRYYERKFIRALGKEPLNLAEAMSAGAALPDSVDKEVWKAFSKALAVDHATRDNRFYAWMMMMRVADMKAHIDEFREAAKTRSPEFMMKYWRPKTNDRVNVYENAAISEGYKIEVPPLLIP